MERIAGLIRSPRGELGAKFVVLAAAVVVGLLAGGVTMAVLTGTIAGVAVFTENPATRRCRHPARPSGSSGRRVRGV
jgi:hypothetical protein